MWVVCLSESDVNGGADVYLFQSKESALVRLKDICNGLLASAYEEGSAAEVLDARASALDSVSGDVELVAAEIAEIREAEGTPTELWVKELPVAP